MLTENAEKGESRGQTAYTRGEIKQNAVTNRGKTDANASARSPDMESTRMHCSCSMRFRLAFDWDAMRDIDLASLLIIL